MNKRIFCVPCFVWFLLPFKMGVISAAPCIMSLTKTIQSSHPISFKHWFLHYHHKSPKSFLSVPDSLNTQILLEASTKISAAIPPLNMSANMAHIGTTLFYLYLHTMYISLKMSHPSWSYWGTFLYITYPLHAHCMNHLVHLHWSNYINIMNNSNNKHHYYFSVSFCY